MTGIRWNGAAAVSLTAAALMAVTGCASARPDAGSTAAAAVTVGVPAAAGPAKLPAVRGGGVRALWQGAPWNGLTFAGGMVLGVRGNQVDAIRAATGAPAWTAALPATLSAALGLVPAGNVVIVEAGRPVGQPPARGTEPARHTSPTASPGSAAASSR
jgi:hypothetical protein